MQNLGSYFAISSGIITCVTTGLAYDNVDKQDDAQMTSVKQTPEQVKVIMIILNLCKVVCMLDQELYAKAAELLFEE